MHNSCTNLIKYIYFINYINKIKWLKYEVGTKNTINYLYKLNVQIKLQNLQCIYLIQ